MMLLINSIIISIAGFVVSAKIFGKTIEWRCKKYQLIILIFIFTIQLSYIITPHFLRVLFNYVVFFVLNLVYYNKKIFEVMLNSFFVFIITFISEVIIGMITIYVFNIDISQLLNSYEGQFFTNVFIAIIMVLFTHLLKSLKFFKFLAEVVEMIKFHEVIPLLIIIIFSYAASFYYFYFQIIGLTTLALSTVMIFVICILIMILLKEKKINVRLKKEYETLIYNLNEYEKILEKYRMTNHENLNNFIIIKGMIEDNRKEVIKHIDEIIKLKKHDDNELLFKTKKLPTGGLQGLIYQKMLIMKEKGVVCNLQISKNVEIDKIMKIDFETIKDLCLIVGVFIDNAIEAVINLEKKIVGIYVYMDDEDENFCFSISNNFSGFIDLEKIDNIGYSSKGTGRGYGLSLVKKIVNNNGLITINREIIGDMFKQTIKIKIN